jgi:hypothetical protein
MIVATGAPSSLPPSQSPSPATAKAVGAEPAGAAPGSVQPGGPTVTESPRPPAAQLATVDCAVLDVTTPDGAAAAPNPGPTAAPAGTSDASYRYYWTGYSRVLGPAGWACEFEMAQDGSSRLTLTPPDGSGASVIRTLDDSSGGSLELRAYLSGPLRDYLGQSAGYDTAGMPTRPAGERISRVQPGLYRVTDAAGVPGLLDRQRTSHPASGLAWFDVSGDGPVRIGSPATEVYSCSIGDPVAAVCATLISVEEAQLTAAMPELGLRKDLDEALQTACAGVLQEATASELGLRGRVTRCTEPDLTVEWTASKVAIGSSADPPAGMSAAAELVRTSLLGTSRSMAGDWLTDAFLTVGDSVLVPGAIVSFATAELVPEGAPIWTVHVYGF